MKKKSLLVLVVMALLVLPGASNAATIDIDGPSLVSGTFTFDVFFADTALTNVDFWQLGLEISPSTPAFFVGVSGDAETNYIFLGDNDGLQGSVGPPHQIVFGDLTDSGAGVTDFAGKLLATVEVDVSGASAGDMFSVDLFGGAGNNFVYDNLFTLDADGVNLSGPYEFTVVPIPAAAWLLGAGLLGLVGLRRKSS